MSLLASVTEVVTNLPMPVPNPSPIQPPGTDGINTILGWLKWGGLAVAVGGIIAIGVMMTIPSRRHDGGEAVGHLGKALGGVILIGAAASLIGFLAG